MSLTERELERFSKKLGKEKTIVASGIAQLYIASCNPQQVDKGKNESIVSMFPSIVESKEWIYTRVFGAVLFIIDRGLDTFLFQIFDMEKNILRFQCELYEDLDYIELQPQFHSFEIDHCVAGFNFSDAKVAQTFRAKVNALKPKKSKNMQGKNNDINNNKTIYEEKEHHNDESKKSSSSSSTFSSFFGSSKNRAPGTRKRDFLFKLVGAGPSSSSSSSAKNKQAVKEIGQVTGVVRNTHIGVKPDGTFDVSNIPSEWKSIFREAGIRKKDLTDPKMSQVIQQILFSSGVNTEKKTITRGYSIVKGQKSPEVLSSQKSEQIKPLSPVEENNKTHPEPIKTYEQEKEIKEDESNKFINNVVDDIPPPPPPPSPPCSPPPSPTLDEANFDDEEETIPPPSSPPPMIIERGSSQRQENHEEDEVEFVDIPPPPPTPKNFVQFDEENEKFTNESNVEEEEEKHVVKPPSFLDDIKKVGMKNLKKVNNVVQEKTEIESTEKNVASTKNALLESIREGNIKLKSVNNEDNSEEKQQPPRPTFLNDIERGIVRLRKVSVVEALPELNRVEEETQMTLLAKLKHCVQERRQHIKEDEDSDDGSDDDDDWSDDGF